MSYTRTVRTTYSDGSGGDPKVSTRTFNIGGDGGASFGVFSDGGFPKGIDMSMGDNRYRFSRGGDESNGGGGFQLKKIGMGDFPGYRKGGGGKKQSLAGRPSRTSAKNPFAGLDVQNFQEIKAKCLQDGILFEDPEFPAIQSSVFFSRESNRQFEWKRPSEVCSDPQWIVEGASRFDVKQGELGDCWLLAAVASLTIDQKLFSRVVPPDQSFTQDYCGVFRFQFWHQGDWQDVVVDDRLPTYYDQLVFMHSASKNEFWSALLEKAYAKLMGSYESLKGGSTCEAMEDFTGGVTEMFDLRKAPDNLIKIMMKAAERSSLMGCSIDADPGQLEAELSNGLIMGHAYSITAIKMVDINTPRMQGQIPLVRIRNPWGNEAEWKGAWSDKSQEWRFIPDDEKQEIGLTFDDDGEFWMSFKDFMSNFQKLEICNLGPDSVDEEEQGVKKRWETTVEHGEWKPRVNAGGCRNYLDTFWTNPQYRVKLTDVDDEDDDNLCTMIVGLLQKDRRKKRKEGQDMLTIGYAVYKLPDDCCGHLDLNFFKYHASCAKSPSFINLREVTGRHKLEPGNYAIVPTTFEPNLNGSFLLRLFTEKKNESGEIDEETRIMDDQQPTIPAGLKDFTPSYDYKPSPSSYGRQQPEPSSYGRQQPEPSYGGQRPEPSYGGQQPTPSYDYNPTPSYGGQDPASSYGFKDPGYDQTSSYRGQDPKPSYGFTDPSSMFDQAWSFVQPVFNQRSHAAPTQTKGPGQRRPKGDDKSKLSKDRPEATAQERQQEDALKQTFRRVAGDDMEIDAYELRDILNCVFTREKESPKGQEQFKFDGFGIDTCRSMVAMHDGDMSGKLGFEEFKTLWTDLRHWKNVFKQYDIDQSGSLSSYELRSALNKSGFRLSNRTLSALVLRYSNKDGQIEFGDFVLCAIRLKTMLQSYKSMDPERSGMAMYSVDDFIQTTMYS